MDRYLFIVSRAHPALYDDLARQFATDPKVEIVLDRRFGERRTRRSDDFPERRQRDRRRNEEVQAQLRERFYAVVTVRA